MKRARRLAIAMLAAGAAFAVAGAEGQTAKRSRGRAPDSVLVRIGNEAITSGLVQRRIEELPEHVRPQFTTPEGRQRLIDRLVEERVWLLTSLKQGVADRPDIKRQIEQQRRDLLIRTYVNEVMAENPAPSDSEARAWYDAHTDEYRTPATVTISHVLSRTESEAKRVRQWARSQDWAKLVTRYSADTLTRGRAGMLGPTTREGVIGHLGRQPALAESAFALGEGRIGGPWKTEHGWHVIKTESLKPDGVRGFDQVRGTIVRQMSAKRSQDFYQSRLGAAKSALAVRADSSAIRKYVSQKKTARERFNEAQAAGPPPARIEAYRTLIQEYPDSDVSPQAAFMIGFIQSEELKDYAAAEQTFQGLLKQYPKSELAASARWMLEHMRSESAPEFMNLEGDSIKVGTAPPKPGKDKSEKP